MLQDPTWERSGRKERGRDKCRVPLPWSGDTPPFGFSSSTDTWLPMPADWAPLTVEKQEADPDSTLAFFRRALELRRGRGEFAGGAIDFRTAPRDAVVFERRDGGLLCVLNAGEGPIALPAGEVILSSAPLVDGELSPDSAAWLV
jgi:alpha-glucosidase